MFPSCSIHTAQSKPILQPVQHEHKGVPVLRTLQQKDFYPEPPTGDTNVNQAIIKLFSDLDCPQNDDDVGIQGSNVSSFPNQSSRESRGHCSQIFGSGHYSTLFRFRPAMNNIKRVLYSVKSKSPFSGEDILPSNSPISKDHAHQEKDNRSQNSLILSKVQVGKPSKPKNCPSIVKNIAETNRETGNKEMNKPSILMKHKIHESGSSNTDGLRVLCIANKLSHNPDRKHCQQVNHDFIGRPIKKQMPSVKVPTVLSKFPTPFSQQLLDVDADMLSTIPIKMSGQSDKERVTCDSESFSAAKVIPDERQDGPNESSSDRKDLLSKPDSKSSSISGSRRASLPIEHFKSLSSIPISQDKTSNIIKAPIPSNKKYKSNDITNENQNRQPFKSVLNPFESIGSVFEEADGSKDKEQSVEEPVSELIKPLSVSFEDPVTIDNAGCDLGYGNDTAFKCCSSALEDSPLILRLLSTSNGSKDKEQRVEEPVSELIKPLPVSFEDPVPVDNAGCDLGYGNDNEFKCCSAALEDPPLVLRLLSTSKNEHGERLLRDECCTPSSRMFQPTLSIFGTAPAQLLHNGSIDDERVLRPRHRTRSIKARSLSNTNPDPVKTKLHQCQSIAINEPELKNLHEPEALSFAPFATRSSHWPIHQVQSSIELDCNQPKTLATIEIKETLAGRISTYYKGLS